MSAVLIDREHLKTLLRMAEQVTFEYDRCLHCGVDVFRPEGGSLEDAVARHASHCEEGHATDEARRAIAS